MMLKFGKTEYVKTKYTSLSGKTEVSFVAQEGGETPFTVIARGDGIEVKGTLSRQLSTHMELKEFALELGMLIDASWKERENLRPHFAKTLAGH